MKKVFLALVGLALTAAVPGRAAETVHKAAAAPARAVAKPSAAKKPSAAAKPAPAKVVAATKPAPAKKKRPRPAKPPVEAERSEEAARVADWIAASGDNDSLPYIIVDKKAAALFLFDAKGKPLGKVPVLIGVAVGDDATPGIGAKTLAEIGPAEKTTPAGRFLAKFGLAAGKEKVLWVDYATSVALHPIPPGTKKEHRRERMLSPTIDDNRITFGCINVPQAFYGKSVRPLFLKKGGYVYVLPDTKPIEDVFPRLRVQAVMSGGGS